MTIKELCNEYQYCFDCPFNEVCPYGDFWDIPLKEVSDVDNIKITGAIIETAKLLQEDNK